MKLCIRIVVALAALAAMAPAAAQDANVDARDPERLRGLFQAWGYQPQALQQVEGDVVFVATIGGIESIVVLDDCRAGRDCSHVVLISNYTDVPNAPYEWINRQNYDYNLVTVMRGEEGELTLRTGIMLGTAGIPQSVMRAHLADWAAANAEIARRATQAGLVRD